MNKQSSACLAEALARRRVITRRKSHAAPQGPPAESPARGARAGFAFVKTNGETSPKPEGRRRERAESAYAKAAADQLKLGERNE